MEERLRAFLLDSSEHFIRPMAFASLGKYQKLSIDDLRAAMDLIVADSSNPALRTERLSALIRSGYGFDVTRQVEDLLRTVGIEARKDLVEVLATDLRNERTAQLTLESVAAADPDFEVRAQAKRALGVEPRFTSPPLGAK